MLLLLLAAVAVLVFMMGPPAEEFRRTPLPKSEGEEKYHQLRTFFSTIFLVDELLRDAIRNKKCPTLSSQANIILGKRDEAC